MGTKAVGPYELSLDLVNPDAEFPDAFALSYAMEERLQQFYFVLEKGETRDEFKSLFRKLAGFEDLHKDRLLKEYGSLIGGPVDPEQFLKANEDAIEGGDLVKNTPLSIIAKLDELQDVFGLSMAIEAQSLDLYTRLAGESNDDAVKKLFLGLADEEKQHLTLLTAEMAKYLKS